MSKDYYAILGVDKDASDDEIKRAYRKLAHQHHPDKSGGDEQKFKEINAAYQVLSDKAKRTQYDQYGQTFDQGGFSGGGQGFGGFDFSGFQGQGGQGFEYGASGFEDIFSDIFGGGFGGGRRGTRKRPGRDIQVDVEISFEEMVRGTERDLKLYKTVACKHCGGSGGEPGAKKEKCSACDGHGQVKKAVRSFLGTFMQVAVCDQCQGAGETFSQKCRECGGDGRRKEDVSLKIRIPAGISDGQTISVHGQGEAGEPGAGSGDLYVNVHVLPHKTFSRKGDDILNEAIISISQAALGDKIDVMTIDGPVAMKIPAGTQSGEIFRIKERGVPHLDKRGRGSQLVKITLSVPKNISREQRDVLERLRQSGL